LLSCLLAASLLPGVCAFAEGEAAAAPAPTPAPVAEPAVSPFVSFFKEGKLNFDMRLRYEYAEVGSAKQSNAFTMRNRLGYTTKKFEGFQAMIELEDNRAADYTAYNAAGLNGQGTRSVIADPEDSELNQLWVDYDFSALSSDVPLYAKLGRQRINLDDERFVGSVGWRQLDQTMDSLLVTVKPMDKLTASYIYIDEVNRIFGASSGLDFDSESHLFNVAYTGLDIGKVVGFAYLLDLGKTGSPGAALSSQTYGVRLDGSKSLNEELGLDYVASLATQSDYGDNATSYNAMYALAEAKLKFKKTAGGFAGAGFELLGSDDGAIAFSTPLATLHKFNGFADSFLATPAVGLRDYYLTGGFDVPGIKAKFSATYHYFTGDDNDAALGSELDLVLAKKLNEVATLLAKYAIFDGDNGRADIERFWLQMDLKF